VLLLDRTSLLQCRPLVANAWVETGDAVEIWPSPAMKRNDRPASVVMEVTPDAEGTAMKLAGAARDGLRPERPFDLYDGEDYVGLASVTTSSDRLCFAKSLSAFCTTRPAVGMRAVSRPPAGRTNARLEARIFDIRPDDNYVLISAGHSDGVAVDQTFAVLHDGKTVARLRVKAVNVDFAGTEPLPAGEEGEVKLSKWDIVVREPVPPDSVRTVGTVSQVWFGGEWMSAVLAGSDSNVKPGAVLRVNSSPPTAAIVVDAAPPRVLLHVPPHWGATVVSTGETIDQLDE
jgi:hypothetical protein